MRYWVIGFGYEIEVNAAARSKQEVIIGKVIRPDNWLMPAAKGSKRHALVDGNGTPLAVRITAVNRPDGGETLPLLDDIPPIHGRHGRPRRKPKALYGDRAYGNKHNEEGLKTRRIEDHLARPRTAHGSGLGEVRYVVERGLAWVGQVRPLKIRYDRLPAMHRAFHLLQMARICCEVLQRDC